MPTDKQIRRCLTIRQKMKGELWNRKIPLTTASRHIRAAADLEMDIHGIDCYKCKVCNSYSMTGLIDIAHIIPSSSFSDYTSVGIINHIYNLLPMCKNCHRKFDSKRKDIRWVSHRYRVLLTLKKHIESVNYIFDTPYPSPVNLDELYAELELIKSRSVLHQEFFDDKPLIIKNDGCHVFISDEKLYEFRDKLMGELITPNAQNSMAYYAHRNHGKGEAYKHGMYDDFRCLLCGERDVCDLAHTYSLKNINVNIPMGVANHIHNLIWLCPNDNHLLDNPPRNNINAQYLREYSNFFSRLQEKLIGHRNKYSIQEPIFDKSYTFNPIDINNWKLLSNQSNTVEIGNPAIWFE